MEYYELVRIHRGNQVTAQQQLQAAIARSGLSASAYARTVLVRNPRTVRRWLAGDSPIPEAVRAYLETTRTTSPQHFPHRRAIP